MHARLYIGLAQNSVDVLFNEVRLAFFDNQQATFAAAERFDEPTYAVDAPVFR